MSDKKQMMDIDKKTSMTPALSDEHQRKWDDDQLERKAKDPTRNYDLTRLHLNFEVTKGGKVQPIDQSKNICKKIEERIAEGVTCKGSVRSTSHRSVNIVYGGNRERMREIAFGKQKLNEDGDNSKLVRTKAIERWAVDAYHFACKKYGEENIVSFIVHLDELNPHAHCVVVPITPDGHLSCKDMFGGKTIQEARKNLEDLHTDYAKEVSNKWGLDRGDDVHVTGAKHVSLEQYHRNLATDVRELEEDNASLRVEQTDLQHNVAKLQGEVFTLEQKRDSLKAENAMLEKSIKGLTTMVNNIINRKAMLEAKLVEIENAMKAGKISVENYEKQCQAINKEIEECDVKLADKQKKLADKTGELATKQQELADVKAQIEKYSPIGARFTPPEMTFTIPHITENPPLLHVDRWKQQQNEQISKSVRDIITTYGKKVMKAAEESIQRERNVYVKTMLDNENLCNQRNAERIKTHELTRDIDTLLSLLKNHDTGSKVCDIAMTLFFGGNPVYVPCAGGGVASSNDGWDGRKKDEDEQAFLRRCFFHASKFMKKVSSKRTVKGSYHR